MRRAAKVLLGTLLTGLLVAASPATAMVPEHVKEQESMFASWILPTDVKDRFLWRAVYVERDQERVTSEMASGGILIRGDCKKHRRGTTCVGVGPFLSPWDGKFKVAADGSEAAASIRHKGDRYSFELDGSESFPGLYEAVEICGSIDEDGNESWGQGRGGGLFRTAEPRGNFAGRKLTPRSGEGFSLIFKGAMITECDSNGMPRFEIRPDGVRASWFIPAVR